MKKMEKPTAKIMDITVCMSKSGCNASF